jgi:hypothetical protein
VVWHCDRRPGGNFPDEGLFVGNTAIEAYCVSWPAQPPFWMRRGALLNEAQNIAVSWYGGGLEVRKPTRPKPRDE